VACAGWKFRPSNLIADCFGDLFKVRFIPRLRFVPILTPAPPGYFDVLNDEIFRRSANIHRLD
jgi:hypothetical protein